MSRERITIETDETGRGQVVGGRGDGALGVVRRYDAAPLVVLVAVPGAGPNGEPGFDANIESPAGLTYAQAIAVLEATARQARARIAAGRPQW